MFTIPEWAVYDIVLPTLIRCSPVQKNLGFRHGQICRNNRSMGPRSFCKCFNTWASVFEFSSMALLGFSCMSHEFSSNCLVVDVDSGSPWPCFGV
jgi:hypothetical protein